MTVSKASVCVRRRAQCAEVAPSQRPKRSVRQKPMAGRAVLVNDAIGPPLDYLRQLVGEANCQARPRVPFEPPAKADIDEYTIDVLGAMAKGALVLEPEQLGARNKFGVTLLHKACRYPNWPLAKYLTEAKPELCGATDDLGRNALHDACWNDSVDFDVIDLLVAHDAQALIQPDARGHSPLCFVPEVNWGKWKKYLASRREDLRASLADKRAEDREAAALASPARKTLSIPPSC